MPPKRPTAVTVIAILHFVFGGFGLLCGIYGAAMQLGGGNAMFAGAGGAQAGQPSPLQQEMQKQINEAKPGPVNYARMGGSLLTSVLMIVSGVGLLQMQPWSRTLSILYAILSMALTVFSTIFTFAVEIPALNAFIAQHPAVNEQEAM